MAGPYSVGPHISGVQRISTEEVPRANLKHKQAQSSREPDFSKSTPASSEIASCAGFATPMLLLDRQNRWLATRVYVANQRCEHPASLTGPLGHSHVSASLLIMDVLWRVSKLRARLRNSQPGKCGHFSVFPRESACAIWPSC